MGHKIEGKPDICLANWTPQETTIFGRAQSWKLNMTEVLNLTEKISFWWSSAKSSPWYLHRLWSPSFRRPFNGVNTKEATTEKWEMLGVCWVNEKKLFASCVHLVDRIWGLQVICQKLSERKVRWNVKGLEGFSKKSWTVLTYFHLFVFGLEGSLQNPKPESLNKLPLY